MPPCQGGGREFEPRLPLHLYPGDVAKWLRQGSAKPLFSGSNPLVASNFFASAGVAELADAEDLKSSALKRLVGSRPSPGTILLAVIECNPGFFQPPLYHRYTINSCEFAQ